MSIHWAVWAPLALAVGIATTAPTFAEEQDAKPPERVQVSLFSNVGAVEPGRPFRVGVHLRIQEDWHVYWQEPGDAGLPPTFTWTLPPGFAIEGPSWPLPRWHKVDDAWTMIYAPDAFFAFQVRAPSQVPANVTLSLQVEWLVCHDAKGCFPGVITHSLSLPRAERSPAPRSKHALMFERHDEDVPAPMPPSWHLSEDRRRLHLFSMGPWAEPDATFEFFPLDLETFDRAAPLLVSRNARGTVLRVPFKTADGGVPPDSFRGVLAVRTPDTTAAYHVGWSAGASTPAPETIEPTADPPPEPQDDLAWAHAHVSLDDPAGNDREPVGASWLWAVLLAFLGGLILNLMPCVLPVLSLKILSLVDHAQDTPVRLRRQAYAFSAGVVVSFLAVAGVLLALRAAGAQIGWGFQMQEPGIVAVLAFLMLLLALNLFGVFEVGMGLTRWEGASKRTGYAGSFATGVLTTVVATPCTAPFMGTAIGYAMTKPAVTALSVFAALGVGMSAPYVLVASFPSLLRWIPRPGPWMVTLRHVLAFPLLATVVWLAWVFGRQRGGDSVAILLVGLLMAGAAAWLFGRFGGIHRRPPVRWLVGRGLALLVLAGGLGVVWRIKPSHAPTSSSPEGWVAYDGHKIRSHQRAGRPVFLDFTADWCLTCKANDAATLQTETVAAAFAKHRVVPMLADWTRRDDRITRALARLDRNSVPVYVIVPPDPARPVVVLRTAITPQYVADALDTTLPSKVR